MILKKKTLLFLSPHTDDIELGCGGLITQLREEKCDIYVIAFSDCKNSVPSPFPPDTLRHEFASSMSELGIPNDKSRILDFSVRTFPSKRQEILDHLIVLRKEINPDLIFVPSKEDVHQDHGVITSEAIRAFKNCSILSYELPWNNFQSESNFYVSLTESDLEGKIKAISHYKSQSHRRYCNSKFIKSLATLRGVQAGSEYAEAYNILRLLA